MTDEERADRCYECTGYGDDWYTDPETGEQVRACDECPYNGEEGEEGPNEFLTRYSASS